MVVVLAERERRPPQFVRYRSEPVEQRLAPRNDEPDVASQHLRLAARQMKLAPADIDPHVVVGRHQIRVTGKSQPSHIEQCRQMLIGHPDVDVLQMN